MDDEVPEEGAILPGGSGARGGAGGREAGGSAGRPPGDDGAAGSKASDGGAPNGGGASGSTAGAAAGGTTSLGGAANLGGAAGASGRGGEASGGAGGEGPALRSEGPCDLYADAETPCVAAYSAVRALTAGYQGPLYQVRSDSSVQNPGTGGQTHDIGITPEGFADSDALDAVCSGTLCTVSLLYDQSGGGNHLSLAPQSPTEIEFPNYETVIRREGGSDELVVGGRRVYSLSMEANEGYRLPRVGDGVPLGSEPQGIYLLADGTHHGAACCWDFGNASPEASDPSQEIVTNALFLGTGFWGRGAGAGPWFMADFGVGVWAGGTNPGDPGWGATADDGLVNPDNPTLAVPFALGFLKTNESDWSLGVADAETADGIISAYFGGLPVELNNRGGIVLGVGGDNGNSSYGTFYEGAVVAGFPSDAAELAVLRNIQAAGYGR